MNDPPRQLARKTGAASTLARTVALLVLVTGATMLQSCRSSDASSGGATPTTSPVSTTTGRRGLHTVSLPAEPIVQTDARPETPLEVQFSVTNVEDFAADSFTWEFGDGETSVEEAPLHRYEAGGVYEARLVYLGPGVRPRSVDWTVELNHPPVVRVADGGVLSDAMGMGIWLEATAEDLDGPLDAETLLWDFGDGVSMRGARVSHVYEKEGVYRVEVGGTDQDGAIAMDSVEVEIVRVTHEESVPPATENPPPEEDGDQNLADDPDPEVPTLGDGPPDATDGGDEPASGTDGGDSIAGDDPPDTTGAGDPDGFPEESLPEDPLEPPVVVDPYSGPTEAVVLDFESPLPWIDGTVLRLVTDPTAVYGGTGALEIHGGAGDFPPAALDALSSLLAPYVDSPELHVAFVLRASAAVTLDSARVREAAESLVAAAGETLDETALAVLAAFVENVEAQPSVQVSLAAGEWYCIELSALLTELDSAPALQATLSVRGQPVLTGWFRAFAPALALEGAVPLVLESYRQSNPSAVLTLDSLRVDNAPFAGCP